MSVGSFVVGNRTRIRVYLAHIALERLSDTASAVRRRRTASRIEAASWTEGTEAAVLHTTSALRALDLASRGGNVIEAPTNTSTDDTQNGTHSTAVRRFELSRIAALRAEAGFYFTVSLVSGFLATCSWFVVDGVTSLSTPLTSGLKFSEALSKIRHVVQSASDSHISSPSSIILYWWLGWQIIAMASLVILARSLQGAWDADDTLAHSAVSGTQSQALALAAAGEAYAAGTGACVPLTLERIADGVYRRTTEDAAGRRLGLQMLSNPIHDLLHARRAWTREQARLNGHEPVSSGSPPIVVAGARSLLLATGSSSARQRSAHASAPDTSLSPSHSSQAGKAGGSLVVRSTVSQHTASAEMMPVENGPHGTTAGVNASEAGGVSAVALSAEASRGGRTVPRLRITATNAVTATSPASTAREMMTPHAAAPRENCYVCFERSGDGVFMECGHAGTCMTCAETIVYGHTKRRIMTREALMALSATGAQISTVRPLAEGDAAALLTERAGEVTDGTPVRPDSASVSTPAPRNLRVPLMQRPASGCSQAMLILEGHGRVPWLENCYISSASIDGLAAGLELVRSGRFNDQQMRMQVSAAIRLAMHESTAARPLRSIPIPIPPRSSLPPSLANLPPGAANDNFLVTVELGGSGVCPVCRAPVTSLLRLGPDVRTTDGRVVAIVLPQSVYWALGGSPGQEG